MGTERAKNPKSNADLNFFQVFKKNSLFSLHSTLNVNSLVSICNIEQLKSTKEHLVVDETLVAVTEVDETLVVVAVIVAGVAVDTAEEEEVDSTVETAEVVVAATTEETITIGMIVMSGTIATEAAIVAMITKPSKD